MRTWIAVGAVVSLISINPLAQPQSPASLFTGCMEVELRVDGYSPRQESMIRSMGRESPPGCGTVQGSKFNRRHQLPLRFDTAC